MIQPHFDYACSTWYPSLTQYLKNRIQKTQNKCIRYCLELDSMTHMNFNEFEKINRINTHDRFVQIICTNAFKFLHGKCLKYLSEVFSIAHQINIATRSSFRKLTQPFRKTNMGQNSLSFLAPKEWNKLPKEIKDYNTVNTPKHKLKQHFLDILKLEEDHRFY